MLCSGYELDESSDKEGIIELNKKEKILVINILKTLEKKLWILLLHRIDLIVWAFGVLPEIWHPLA